MGNGERKSGGRPGEACVCGGGEGGGGKKGDEKKRKEKREEEDWRLTWGFIPPDTHARTSSRVCISPALERTTNAPTTSPYLWSGTATTAASCTEACSVRRFSIWTGNRFYVWSGEDGRY